MSKTYTGTINIESIFSEDNRHRFVLRRRFTSSRRKNTEGKCVFILINPSFSDELLFDKTNRIASNIGVIDGYDEVVILNLFSLITKDKKTLNNNLNIANHIENDRYIAQEVENANRVVISWGIDGQFNDRIEEVKQLIRETGIDNNQVLSIYYKDKNGKEFNPAHLSLYITENQPNYQLKKFDLN